MPLRTRTIPWHDGERRMHRLLNVPPYENPTSTSLESFRATYLEHVPLFAIGMLDEAGHPWTSLWGGDEGFITSMGNNELSVEVPIDLRYDPVARIIRSMDDSGSNRVASKVNNLGQMAGLGIDLNRRSRLKIGGQTVANKLNLNRDRSNLSNGSASLQVILKVGSSLGNCPKYLNRKHITSHPLKPKLISETLPLSSEATELLEQADSFYITSSAAGRSLSTNYRGGTPGFVRTMSNDSDRVSIAWPEYSGNRVYSTLGNLMVTSEAGLVFPDMKTGCVLYVTGQTNVLVGSAAASIIPKANIVVTLEIVAARLIQSGLAFRARDIDYSPYNPPIFHLATEKGIDRAGTRHKPKATATLVGCEQVAPSIIRFKFNVTGHDRKPVRWISGQYVIFSFKDELDQGYSYMREDNPRSLNDDWTRSFTISTPAPSHGKSRTADFELIIRNVGVATGCMFEASFSHRLELPVLGFDGEFLLEHHNDQEIVGFVAAGVSITPFTAQLPRLDTNRVRGWWSVKAIDLNLVLDTLKRIPGMAENMRIFITGSPCQEQCDELCDLGARVEKRRLTKADLIYEHAVSRWYVCTGPKFSKDVLRWLEGKDVVVEDYSY